ESKAKTKAERDALAMASWVEYRAAKARAEEEEVKRKAAEALERRKKDAAERQERADRCLMQAMGRAMTTSAKRNRAEVKKAEINRLDRVLEDIRRERAVLVQGG
ncbi:hypothetical protein C0991_001885, partial [Blastosporella zonata]